MRENPAFWQNRPGDNYRREEDDRLVVWCRGVLTHERENRPDPLKIAHLAENEKLDYNRLHGGFCLVSLDKKTGEYLFFGDNALSQSFFFSREQRRFSDSFLFLCRQKKTRETDFAGIAQLIDFGAVIGNGTPVSGIERTDPECYYRYDPKGNITAFSKRLQRFSDMERGLGLDDVFAPVLRATAVENSCAVCTGGTDSRTVLSDLARNERVPELLLTAHPGNPDLPAADAVARALGRELKLVDFSAGEADWLLKGFCFLDGGYDAVLAFRQLKKARYAREKGFTVEYGGVGGEFYKNDYCNTVRNWRARTRRQRLEALTENGSAIRSSAIYSEKLKAAEGENDRLLHALVETAEKEDGLLAACNRLGYSLLSAQSAAITNGYAALCTKIDPLMDRSLVASASQERPASHKMHLWQRRQIHALCPQLGEAATDQGYSCSLRPLRLVGEELKKLAFFADRALARVKRMLGMKWKSMEQRYWDEDYLAARAETLWEECVRVCKEREILAPGIDAESLSLESTGTILQLGMLFSPSFDEYYDRCFRSFAEEEETEHQA